MNVFYANLLYKKLIEISQVYVAYVSKFLTSRVIYFIILYSFDYALFYLCFIFFINFTLDIKTYFKYIDMISFIHRSLISVMHK